MGLTVWVTEKPSAAKDLAVGLCHAWKLQSQPKDGYIELSNGDIVLPLAGHLLEVARPAEYLNEKDAEAERTFKFEQYKNFLPILPKRLIKHPRRDSPKKGDKQGPIIKPYLVAEKLLKRASRIINAGDIDREGQLIVDELLEHFGINPRADHVLRFALASNLPEDIAKAVQKLEPNGSVHWRRASEAALARQYLDWVWGINLSMVGQVKHRNPRISAGRVQTPVLALIDARCREIENFKPHDYFVPIVVLADGTIMRWKARRGSEGQPGFDSEGRIISEQLALAIVGRIKNGLPGEITKAEVKQYAQKPPLGYSLSSLQAAASKALGITLEQAGEAAKNLYQVHKAISYIGTDCKYLPESMHAEAPRILQALTEVAEKMARGADPAIRSPIFNDSKLDEHFAIIPTGRIPRGLNDVEQGVFMMVVRRFIAQFYPDYIYRRHKIEARFGEDEFVASERQDVRLGWREVDGQSVPVPDEEDVVSERDKASEREDSLPRQV